MVKSDSDKSQPSDKDLCTCDIFNHLNLAGSVLQAVNSRNQIMDFAIQSFLSFGFERVRFWLIDVEAHTKSGGKASYIPDIDFQKIKVSSTIQDGKNLPYNYLKIIAKRKPFVNRAFCVLKKYFAENKLKYSVEFPLYASNTPLGLISVDNVNSGCDIDLKEVEKKFMPFVNHIALVLYRVTTEEKLRDINQNLEQKIALATAELTEKNSRLDYLANHDELTGLFNRRYFNQLLDQKFSHQSCARGVALAIVDLDFLKQINDEHGHLAGDKALVEVARALSAAKNIECAARFGGDEFVALFCNQKISSVETTLKEIQAKLKKRGLGISVGVVDGSATECRTIDDLISVADTQLYLAKERGRGQIVIGSSKRDTRTKILS